MKRLFDFGFTAGGLVVLAPLLLLIAFFVRMKLGSPVLFRQMRPGFNGKPFECLKFRSMTNACDSGGNLLPDDKRLTKFGQFLRSSSLDELPELWNVLKGEMSLVGPRPLRMEYLPLYTKAQAKRHDVRPGITGWAQVNGRNAITWEQKFELDVWYVQHQNFWLDLKIILLTVWKTVLQKDVAAEGHVAMPRFQGSVIQTRNRGDA